MAMGTRKQRERQQDLWIATSDVVETPGNAFYDRLNRILDEHKFDQKVEAVRRKFYKKSPYGGPAWRRGCTSGRCSSVISRVSTRNAGSPGGRRIRYPCGNFWATRWMRRRRIIRRSRGRGACTGWRPTKPCFGG